MTNPIKVGTQAHAERYPGAIVRRQQVLRLRSQGLSYSQIATAMSISRPTAIRLLASAKRREAAGNPYIGSAPGSLCHIGMPERVIITVLCKDVHLALQGGAID